MKITEIFGGIGAGRKALEMLVGNVTSADYVEISDKAVLAYNALYGENKLPSDVNDYEPSMEADIAFITAPCQDISAAGKMAGVYANRTGLLWTAIKKVSAKYVLIENVPYLMHYDRTIEDSMLGRGYTKVYSGVYDASQYGSCQKRLRYYSCYVNGCCSEEIYPQKCLVSKGWYSKASGSEYVIKAKNLLRCIYGAKDGDKYRDMDSKSARRYVHIIKQGDMLRTILTVPDRTPTQVVYDGSYRLMTEIECLKAMGFTDNDYKKLAKVFKKEGRLSRDIYRLAGNSMSVELTAACLQPLLKNLI